MNFTSFQAASMLSSKRPKLTIYSPIPPVKSGTATYLDDLISEMGSELSGFDIQFVADEECYSNLPYNFATYPVIPSCKHLETPEEIILCFIGNNQYHRYVHRFIRRTKSKKIISFIHDLSCYMGVDSMLCSGYDGMWYPDLETYTKLELPRMKTLLVSRIGEWRIPEHLKYSIMCQSVALQRSAVIVTHSHYAALRLCCEHDLGDRKLPILVMRMPKAYTPIVSDGRVPSKDFTIGVFGWISKAKRPVQLIEGLRDFLKTLPEAEQQLVRLKFVGEVADQRYDPHHLAALMGVSSHVACTGYLPIEEFRNQLMDCHVFLNLRFPSCGETSGTLNELSGFDRPYAVSYYQAFAEEGATRHISIDPGTETAEITRFLQDAYRWTKFKDAIPAPQIHFENLASKFSPSDALRRAIHFLH